MKDKHQIGMILSDAEFARMHLIMDFYGLRKITDVFRYLLRKEEFVVQNLQAKQEA